MNTHTFAVIAADGTVLATTGVVGWVERMAPAFGGTPARWLCGGWVAI